MKVPFLYNACCRMEWLWLLGLLKILAAFCFIAITYGHFCFWSALSYLEADPLDTFDFIVSKLFFLSPECQVWVFQIHIYCTYFVFEVGAGSSGAVISSRLSENGHYSVLLLEAGDYPSPFADIPLLSGILPSTPLSRNYQTEPQEVGFTATVGKVNICK